MGRGIPFWYRKLSQLDPEKAYTAEDLAEIAGVSPAAVRKSLRTRGIMPEYFQVEDRVKACWKGKSLIQAAPASTR